MQMTQAGKQLLLVGNWKSHKNIDEAFDFFDGYRLRTEHKVIVCPPMPYVMPLKQKAEGKNVDLGAQDLSPFEMGAYTGAVTASMLKGMIKYVIVGHSERRKYFHETNEVVANKAKLALENEITPIVCVDEPYLESQLAFFEPAEFGKMVVAYEPLAAIGSGKPDSPDSAEKMAVRIKQLTSDDTKVIYGGSVTHENVRSFCELKNIDGVLVGGASLDINEWSLLVDAVK